MTKEEILDYNKRCAKFLEYKYYPHNYEGKIPSGLAGWQKEKAHLKISDTYLCRNDNQLPFRSDWNWIMKVVDKINDIDYDVTITDCECIIRVSEITTIKLRSEGTKIATVEAIYEFLKIYYKN